MKVDYSEEMEHCSFSKTTKSKCQNLHDLLLKFSSSSQKRFTHPLYSL